MPSSKLLKLLLFTAVCIGASMFFSQPKVFANTLPDVTSWSSAGQPGIYEEVSQCGGSITLCANKAWYVEYSTSNNFYLQMYGCPPAGSSPGTWADWVCTGPNASVATPVVKVFNPANGTQLQSVGLGSGYGTKVLVNGAEPVAKGNDSNAPNYYAILVEVDYSAAPVNSLYAFLMDTGGQPGMTIAYDGSDQGSLPFSMQFRESPTSGCSGGHDFGDWGGSYGCQNKNDFYIHFQTACNYGGGGGTLAWSDADGYNWAAPANWSIYFNLSGGGNNINANTSKFSQDPVNIGTNNYVSTGITIPMNTNFTWHWGNVMYNNGVQFFLPANTIGATGIACNSPPVIVATADCSNLIVYTEDLSNPSDSIDNYSAYVDGNYSANQLTLGAYGGSNNFHLQVGQALVSNIGGNGPGTNTLYSQNGNVRLIMQSDGNLVLYDAFNRAIWASSAHGGSVPGGGQTYTLIMQSDGNLVVYGSSSGAIWASSFNGGRVPGPGLNYRFDVQTDGNLVIYNSAGGVNWASGSNGLAPTALQASTTAYDGINGRNIWVNTHDSAGWSSYGPVGMPNCATPTCTPPTAAAAASAGVAFPVNANVTWSPYGPNGSPLPPNMPAISLTARPSSGVTITTSGSQTGGYSGTTETESQGFSVTVTNPGVYTFSESLPAGYSGTSCPSSTTVTVLFQPYLKVYGGDVKTGSGFASNGLPCTFTSGAKALAWDNPSSNPPYAGSSTDQGAFVEDLVNGFASNDALAASGGLGGPDSLTFANSVARTSPFGGMLGTSNCAGVGPQGGETSYYNALKASPYYQPGTYTNNVNGFPAGNGGRNVYLYTGNVFITTNFSFPSGWSGVKNMPLFYVVTDGGNIYIDSNVTQIAGVFIAEPAGGSGGNIYTCNLGGGGTMVEPPADPFSRCTNPLTVTGSLIAQNVHFQRTAGTISQAANPGTTSCTSPDPHAAETICYLPLVWLANPLSASGQLRSITGLPPTL